jgi:hypothetical protein
VNVIESLSGATPVIPWNRNVASKLTYDFGQEKTWISREGITFVASDYVRTAHTRLPSPINIFKALAEASGFELSLSPAGRTCEQIIASLGGLLSVGLVARSKELLDFLNSLAHEDLEVDLDEPQEHEEGKPQRKKPRKAFAPYNKAYSVVRKSNPGNESVADSHLGAVSPQEGPENWDEAHVSGMPGDEVVQSRRPSLNTALPTLLHQFPVSDGIAA